MEKGTPDPARVEAINNALRQEGFRYDETSTPVLLDEDGEVLAKLTWAFAAVLHATALENVQRVPVILGAVYYSTQSGIERGNRYGHAMGRADVIRTAHELLGIDRIVEAIETRRE